MHKNKKICVISNFTINIFEEKYNDNIVFIDRFLKFLRKYRKNMAIKLLMIAIGKNIKYHTI